MIKINQDKISYILKECFCFYSFKIGNVLFSSDNKAYINKFNYTENTSLYNFSNFLKEKNNQYLTIDWLFDYFNFQFTYWSFIKESKNKNGDYNFLIMLHWVLGKKALKRYLNKTSKDTYFYHSNFYPKYNINKNDLIELLENKQYLVVEKEDIIEEDKIILINPLNYKEEENKKRKYNTIEGFFICQQYTTLFKFNSNLCKNCKFKINCKKILKNNYPILYQKRFANKIIMERKKREENGEEGFFRKAFARNKRKFKINRK